MSSSVRRGSAGGSFCELVSRFVPFFPVARHDRILEGIDYPWEEVGVPHLPAALDPPFFHIFLDSVLRANATSRSFCLLIHAIYFRQYSTLLRFAIFLPYFSIINFDKLPRIREPTDFIIHPVHPVERVQVLLMWFIGLERLWRKGSLKMPPWNWWFIIGWSFWFCSVN